MIGCAAAVVLNCFIGFIYYHPRVPTGHTWIKRVFPGKDLKEIDKENQFAMGFSIVVNVFLTLLLKFILVETFKAASPVAGLKLGTGLWCLTLLLELPHVLFARRSLDVFIIEQGHNLLSMAISGTCVAYFP